MVRALESQKLVLLYNMKNDAQSSLQSSYVVLNIYSVRQEAATTEFSNRILHKPFDWDIHVAT
jgi:hypothetical protein